MESTDRPRGRHRADPGPSEAPAAAPRPEARAQVAAGAQGRSVPAAALLTSAADDGGPTDLRPPHPSGPIPVVRDLRPPHPSGPIAIVGAAPMSAVPAEVTDDQLSRFLAEAADLRRATGPIPAPTPARPAASTPPRTAPPSPAPAPARPVTSNSPSTPVWPRPPGAVAARRVDSVRALMDERAMRQFTRPGEVAPPPKPAPQPVVPEPVAPTSMKELLDPAWTAAEPPVAPRAAAASRPAVAPAAEAQAELPQAHPQPSSFFERMRIEPAARPGPSARRAEQAVRTLRQPPSMLRRPGASTATIVRRTAGAARVIGLVATLVVLILVALVLVVGLPTPSLADRAARLTVSHAVGAGGEAVQASQAAAQTAAGHATRHATGSTAGAAAPHPSTSLLTAFATPAASHAAVSPSARHSSATATTSASAEASASASVTVTPSTSAVTHRPSAGPVPIRPIPPVSGAPVSGLPSGAWNLAWSDEFTGSTLSRSRWTTLNDSTFGDGNQQLECEMASNVTLSGGMLTLAAQREQSKVACGSHDSRFPGGRSYSGATIETKGKADFTYGYFEIRAKLPMTPGASKGLWPAFWLRPQDGGAGELDVLETIGTDSTGSPDTVHQTIHPAYGSGTPQQVHTVDYPSGSLSSGYHTYGVDWEPGSISWYIDGKLTWSRTTATTSWMRQDFSRPYFLRLNLAVGGSWPGSPTSGTAFPASYDIDWLRVYQH